MTLRSLIIGVVVAFMAVGWGAACILYRAAEMGANLAPLDPREFSSLTLIALGTGGPYENPERRGPCTAIALGSTIVLVDVGRGVAEGLRSAKIPVSQPEIVLLTNLQAENTVGLDDLLFTGWLVPREEPLRLIGPPGTRELAQHLLAAHRSAIEAGSGALGLPVEGAMLEVLEVEGPWSEQLGDFQISAAEISGGPMPALAWRFEHGQASVVVSGTGWGDDDLVTFATGTDVLVHEAVYIPTPEQAEAAEVLADPDRLVREAALHTSILEVGELATRAGARTLVLVRMRPPPMFSVQVSGVVGEDFDGRILVPDDGDEISIAR